MIGKKNLPLNRLFFRILLYFLSLLIPIVIIGAVFYFNTTNRLKQEFTEKIETQMQSSKQTIDIYLRTTQETSSSFFYDVKEWLMPYDQYSDEDRIWLYKIPRALDRTASNLNAMVDKVFVYVDDQKVYTQNGLEDFDFFFQNYHFEKYGKEFWKEKLKSGKLLEILPPSEMVANNWTHKSVIPFVFTSIVNGHKAVLVAAVSMDMIQHTIRDHAVFDATEFVVTDNDDRILFSSNQQLSGVTHLDHLFRFFHSRDTDQGRFNIAGTEFIVVRVKSEIYGWNYYSLTPVSEFHKQMSYYIASMVTICAVLVITGIVFSFIFTFNLYNPIKRIRDILAQRSDMDDEIFRVPSKENELDFIGTSISRLIEYNDKFKNELEMISIGYLDQCLLNMLHGSATVGGEEIRKRLNRHVSFQHPSYVCCNIRFDFKDAFYNDIQDVDRLHILGKMKKIIWGLLRHYVNVYLLEEKDHLYIGIINIRGKEDLKEVYKALRSMIDTFRYDSQYCFIFIGVGNVYEGIEGIAKSYADAMNALEEADQKLDFQIIESANLPSIQVHYSYSFTDENSILNCLKAGDAANLRSKVEEIIEKNVEKGLPRHRIPVLFKEMYHTGLRFLVERGLNPQEFIGTGMPSSACYNEQKQWLLQFFETIIGRTAAGEQDGPGALTSAIIKYIEENYHHDLYLEKIAEEMGVSSKYISRVFKEKTGVNLISYISWYRISKAKELLLKTDLNVNEISERVGIYSRTTFIRLFKKHEGTTPVHYRKLGRSN